MSPISQREGEAKTQPITDGVEKLQYILATQQGREVTYTEAQEVGRLLVEFYQTLSEDSSNEAF